MTGHPPPCRRHPCPPPKPPSVAILLSMLVIVIVICGCPVTFLQVSCAAAMLHLMRAAVPYPCWSVCRIVALPGPAVPPLPALDHISVFSEGHMASAFALKFLGRHRLPSLYKALPLGGCSPCLGGSEHLLVGPVPLVWRPKPRKGFAVPPSTWGPEVLRIKSRVGPRAVLPTQAGCCHLGPTVALLLPQGT